MDGQRLVVQQGIAAGLIQRLLTEEDGVTAIEYGLMAALIVLIAIGGIQATGTSVVAMYTTWTNAVLGAI